MTSLFICKISKLKFFMPIVTTSRTVRNVNRRRNDGPKIVEGSVKTLTQVNPDVENYDNIRNLQDYVKSVKHAASLEDFEIEEAVENDDFDRVFEKVPHRLDKDLKRFVKKQIIEQKYFKLKKETNLLTYAAKQQVKYLSRLDPYKWTPEALCQSFPISPPGVKKLLKSNFVLSPERIKEHDQKVEKCWQTLESGVQSSSISYYTQKLWNEGKLVKKHYRGNPFLPKKVEEETIVIEEKKAIGEFSAIVQPYVEYMKQKESEQKGVQSTDKLQILEGVADLEKHRTNYSSAGRFNKNKYYIDETGITSDKPTQKSQRSQALEESEMPYHQFKLNMKEEMASNKGNPDKFQRWVENQPEETSIKGGNAAQQVDTKKVFMKTPKYNRAMIDEVQESDIHFDNNQLNFQAPRIKRTKSKNNKRSKESDRGLYKVGNSYYDEDGEFLYKVPR